MKSKESQTSARAFLVSILIIFVLMVFTYILTFVVPGKGISFVNWILSPILVLGAEGNGTLIGVIIFLLVLGGVFNSLNVSGLMNYALDRIVFRFGTKRYRLMEILILFFMALGALVGSFEECIPLVPLVVALALRLGWDKLTGLGMSLLAVGCGFASGVCNPFTVGVAQRLAGLPMFSGFWLRALSFILIYVLLVAFVRQHAKKVENPIEDQNQQENFKKIPHHERGMWCFASIFGIGLLCIISSGFITVLQDYTMIIVAVMFLAAGISSCVICKMSRRELFGTFQKGVLSIFPAVLMILMASSIRYIMEESGILDTLLNGAISITENMPKWLVLLFLYLIVLVLNFFIPSGSAKAFLLMPLLVPIAQMNGITAQLTVLAFAFGDGFSNVFYPTNPALLISLGLTNVSYEKWFKWSGKFQLLNLVLTTVLLLFGLAIGY